MSGSNDTAAASIGPTLAGRQALLPTSNVGAVVSPITKHFVGLPGNFTVWEFLGVAFLVVIVARHWGRFVNRIV